MLEKTVVISQIEVSQSNIVQVRTSTIVAEDGKILSESYHRHCISPGQDYSQEDERVREICAVAHTPAVVAEYESRLAALEAE